MQTQTKVYLENKH